MTTLWFTERPEVLATRYVAVDPVPLVAVIASVLAGVAPFGAPVNVEVKVIVEPRVVGLEGFAATAIVGVDRAAVAVTV